VLAQLARGRMRAKITTCRTRSPAFTDHHAFLLAKMLARVDAIDADMTRSPTPGHLASWAK
jgi:hypothetical protein